MEHINDCNAEQGTCEPALPENGIEKDQEFRIKPFEEDAEYEHYGMYVVQVWEV